MLLNYLKIAYRIVVKQKVYSFINIFGLSTGIAACLLIALYVQFELSYDRFHAKADRTYRVAATLHLPAGPNKRAVTSPPVGIVMKSDFPEIESMLRIGRSVRTLSYSEKTFYDVDLFTADPTFFDVFDFPFTKGDPKKALRDPNTIVITETTAKKYFGSEDPLGQLMMLSDTISLLVDGVIRDIPENSHLKFDCLYSRTTLSPANTDYNDQWYNNQLYTYVVLPPDMDANTLERNFPAMLDRHMGSDRKNQLWYEFHLQPLTDIHLHSSLNSEIEANSSITYIYAFASIAVFILVIACINFINMATARSLKRASEVGIRKVTGAARSQLVYQFLGEALLITIASAFIALVLVQGSLTFFNQLMQRSLSLHMIHPTILFCALTVLILFVTLVAGGYPAFILSGFKPVDVLKGKVMMMKGGNVLRHGLVTLQFTVTITLISCMIIVEQQLDFVQQQNLGFDQEQLVVLNVRSPETAERYHTIKQQLKQNPNIVSVSASSHAIGRGLSRIATLPEGASDHEITSINSLIADHEFLSTYKIPLVAGRNFSYDHPSDAQEAFMVNESAVKLFGWGTPTQAIGKTLDWGLGKQGKVIGVIVDFHYQSLHHNVEPLIVHIHPDWYGTLTIRLKPKDISSWPQALASIQGDWDKLQIKSPFEYSFLDADFARQYESDQRLGAFFKYFSALAILIACLGLFGLAAFTTEQKRKEIGVRKVLGASVRSIIGLLSKNYIKLILMGNTVAIPVTWIIMDQWLSNFAYQITISMAVFLISGSVATVVAIFTVGYESMKAAFSNPVHSLKAD